MRMHLASLVDEFRTHGGEAAVVSHRGVRRYTSSYGDLARLAGRFAAELERRKIRAGERVVLSGENSTAWIGVFFGCLLRGVLVVPLDRAGSVEFAERVLGEVTPRLVVGDATLLRGLRTELPTLDLGDLEANLPAEMDFRVDASVGEDTPFQIVFTSGTTAAPKGVVHTHRNVLASLRPIETEMAKYRRYERWVHPLRFLHSLPLSHVFGQFMGLWVPALLGAEVHFVDGLEPARTVALIRRERISVLIAVPRVLGILRAHLLERYAGLAAALDESGGLRAWKRWWHFRAVHRELGWKFWAVISGGASLPEELEQFWNRLGFAVIQGYGMTETAALITLNHPFRIGKGTIGKVLPGREVRLGADGEILVRGEMVSDATWQGGQMQRREGEWLATGDLAEQTGSGDLRFLGRKGDMIVASSGLKIHPSDVESVLLKQPGVKACAVVPCTVGGGVEPVCVVLFAGEDWALDEAVAEANRGLAEFQRIRRTLRWPEMAFPYTSTGKLLRRSIRDWACAALAGGTDGAGRGNDGLLGLISETTGAKVAKEDDGLRLSEDLYLDSLARVQLASAIEQRFGVELDEGRMATLVTLGDLRKAVGLSGTSRDELGFELRRGEPPVVSGEVPAVTDPYVYPRWPWSWPVQALRVAALELVFRPLIGLLLGPRVRRRSPGIAQEPLLIVANHVTLLDGALVLYGLPGRLRRRVAIAMSGEMLLDFRNARGQGSWFANWLAPVAYWLLTAMFNVFPLPRLQGFRRSFAHAGEALDRGYSVLVFPEGHRSATGVLQPFRPGIGLLASQSRVPVLPVLLVGMETLEERWFRASRLEIRVGEPVTMPEGTSAQKWTERLEAEMRLLGGSG